MPELTAVMRGVIRTNIDLLTGGIGQISDGLVVGSTGATENWLLVGQNGGADNGPYTVTPLGVWARHTEMGASDDFIYNKKIAVQFGVTYGNSEWYLSSPSNPTVGTTLLDFKPRSFEVPREAGMGLEDNAPFIQLPERPGVAGSWVNPIVTFTDRGVAEGVTSGAATQTTLVEAMKTAYLSANSVRVEAGAIFVPGVGLLEYDAAVDKTGLVLTANTWYYLYAYSSEGLPTIEVSTQRPASPYRGEARMKGGPDNTTPDTSPSTTHRYVPYSAFYAAAANTIWRFHKSGRFTRWVADLNTTLRAVSSATNTTTVAADISSLAPATADMVEVAAQLVNSDNSSTLYVSASGDGLQTVGVAATAGQLYVQVSTGSTRAQAFGPVALVNNTRTLHHAQTAFGASRLAHIEILGYYEGA